MILIAGLASSGSVWNGVVAHYRDRYEVHVLQLPGMAGQSTVSDTAVLALVARDVQRYIHDKALRRPVIAGHSVGGLVALRVAIESPAIVGPVVSVDALPFGAVVQMPGATAASMQPIAAAVRATYAKATRQQLEAQMRAGAPGMTTTPAFVDTLAAWMGRSDPATLGNVTAEAITTDLRDRVALIRAPVLLLGTYGAATDSTRRIGIRASYESQASAIPQHQVALAERARHFIMIDDLPWFLAQMDAFLAEHRVGKVSELPDRGVAHPRYLATDIPAAASSSRIATAVPNAALRRLSMPISATISEWRSAGALAIDPPSRAARIAAGRLTSMPSNSATRADDAAVLKPIPGAVAKYAGEKPPEVIHRRRSPEAIVRSAAANMKVDSLRRCTAAKT